MGPIRVVGLGNAMAGDDGAGVLAARRLQATLGARACVVEAGMAPLDVLTLMEGAQALILVDAVRSGEPAGTVHRLDASADLRGGIALAHSTHALGARDALELGRVLGLLPPVAIVYGIEAATVGSGTPMSPEVLRAVDEVTRRVAAEVDRILRA